MNTKYKIGILSLLILILVLIAALFFDQTPDVSLQFNGDRAYDHVRTQVEFGPRYPGSPGQERLRSWLIEELSDLGWAVETQLGDHNGISVLNLVANKSERGSKDYWVILGAHYDTRFFADRDPEPLFRDDPVLGANDGASGVAVLVELARVLPDFENIELTLVFFDAEDNGSLPGWRWTIGSELFAGRLDQLPDAVVVVDMVGDADQNIYLERTSNKELAFEIWDVASVLGVDSFIFEEKYSIIDDHTPFLALGIPAIDIIDFDYPYWHTTGDTLDKVSPESLENVGRVLQSWLELKDNSMAP